MYRERKKKKTKQKFGNIIVRMCKEKRKSYFTKGWKTGHREGMKHTKCKKKSKKRQIEPETGQQSQDYMTETEE